MRNIGFRIFRASLNATTAFALVGAAVLVPPALPIHAAHAAKRPKAPKLIDSCKPFRKPFSEIKNYQTDKIIKGVIIGAIGGAALEMLAHALGPKEYYRDANGNVRKKGPDILGGAAKGAVAGGLVGYLTSLEQNRGNQAALQAALIGDFAQENGQYAALPQQLADLGNCRNQQIFAVQQQAENLLIATKEGDKRLTKIEKWIAEDDKLIAKAARMQGDSIRTYAQAWAVSEGQSAEEAKNQGDAAAMRYAGEAQLYTASVEIDYTVAGEPIVQPIPPAPVTRQAWITSTQGARLRSEASTSAGVIVTLAYGKEIEIGETTMPGWAAVTVDDNAGYVSDKLLSLTPPPRVVVVKRPAPAPRPAPPPRPEKAAAKIRVAANNAQPTRPVGTVGKAIAQKTSLQQVDAQRRSSSSLQLATAKKMIRSLEASAAS